MATSRQCSNCKYWSELIAQSVNLKLMALCLAEGGPYYSQYTGESVVCPKFEAGTPVDTP